MVSSQRWLRTASWLAVLVWAATIVWLSSRTPQELEELTRFDFWDKGAHFVAFLAGGVLITMAIRCSTTWSWKKVVLVSAATISFFGATDEYHQTFTPNRSGADVFDWIADALGACTGAALMTLVYARSTRSHHPAPTRD